MPKSRRKKPSRQSVRRAVEQFETEALIRVVAEGIEEVASYPGSLAELREVFALEESMAALPDPEFLDQAKAKLLAIAMLAA